jgi:inosine/xanthosine triphosphate pyrophosphatase family protein
MAELSAEDKNAISHRGRAFRQLPGLLEELGL